MNADQPASAVLITGASTGIGQACALELDRRGFRVFAGVRSDADAERLQREGSARLTPVQFDVTDVPAITAAAARLDAELGEAGLAGLVNNAGVVVSGPLELLPLAEFRRQLDVNVVGVLAVTQAFLPLVRKARGRIVNISSANGALAPPYMGPYSASKHAIEGMTDSLRIELRRWGIAVSLVEPGPIKTPIWEKSQAAAEALIDQVAPERMDLYAEDLDQFRKAVADLQRQALSVDHVVKMVVRALTDRRPKARYFGVLLTQFFFKGMRVLPYGLRDWLVRRGMGFSK